MKILILTYFIFQNSNKKNNKDNKMNTRTSNEPASSSSSADSCENCSSSFNIFKRKVIPFTFIVNLKHEYDIRYWNFFRNCVVFVINTFVNFVSTGLIEIRVEILVLQITTIQTSEYAQFVKELLNHQPTQRIWWSWEWNIWEVF